MIFRAVVSLLAVAAMFAVALTYVLSERAFVAELREDGAAELSLQTEILRGWLDRFRGLPRIYSQDPDIVKLLRLPDDVQQLDKVNKKLERWNAGSGAADTYILDASGMALAASNWNDAAPFVGNSYQFRPYFKAAMHGRLGRYFALGTRSLKRGYYFAYPILDERKIVGAAVVKAPVDAIEQDMRLGESSVFVSDARGVVIIAGNPDWRLKLLRLLSPEDEAILVEERQFPLDQLAPLEIEGLDAVLRGEATQLKARPDRSAEVEQSYAHLSQQLTVEQWTAHLLFETREAHDRALLAALSVALTLMLTFLAAYMMLQRRRRILERFESRARAQQELEGLVAERTADLRNTNERLETEIQERVEAERGLRQAQSELVQAGKLAALGQMSASLSHEFNQPLAAIRTYSDNAVAFLERGHHDRASENLARISRLTERMAQLSKHLTSFSRRHKETREVVALDGIISETLALLHGRLERAEAHVENRIEPALHVIGGQVRLQHVFMNLIGNALDASTGREPEILLSSEILESGSIRIAVEDNGAGIDPEALEKIFDPFFSTKEPGKGLGLGLSISFNIIRDFGGALTAQNREDGGARFALTLISAAEVQEAAE